METIGIVVFIIILIILGKFIYDIYLTNNTERNFDKYREKNPIGVAEIEKPKTTEQFNDLVNALNDEIINKEKAKGK